MEENSPFRAQMVNDPLGLFIQYILLLLFLNGQEENPSYDKIK